jgi:hypothetical protein
MKDGVGGDFRQQLHALDIHISNASEHLEHFGMGERFLQTRKFGSENKKTSRSISRVLSGHPRASGQSFIYEPRRRGSSAAYPNPVRTTPLDSYLALLQAGFTLPRRVTTRAVRSYRTFSPLPAALTCGLGGSALCCTFRGLAPPRRYLAPCPVEPGLSSRSALLAQRLPAIA